jgi:hypothetical protein
LHLQQATLHELNASYLNLFSHKILMSFEHVASEMESNLWLGKFQNFHGHRLISSAECWYKTLIILAILLTSQNSLQS